MARSVSTCLALVCALASSACVDPKADFDQHNDELPDPPPPVDAAAGCFQCADISGTYFFAIDPKPLAAGTLIRYRADFVYDEANATVDVSLAPLDIDTLEPVPGVEPSTWTDLPVDCANDASFVIALDNVVIPGEANPIILNTAVTINGTITMDIQNTDTVCGSVVGMVVETGSNLDGSTVGATRAPAGPPWPDPVTECVCE